MRTLLAPFLALVLLSGCAAPIQATRDLPQPTSLAEVNALLDGKRVTVEMADGEARRGVHSASVDAEWVRFATGSGPTLRRDFVAVEAVSRITYVRNRGTRAGVLAGAAPGVLMAGVGGVVFLTAGSADYPVGAAIGGALLGAVGGVLAVVGAPLGGVIGSGVSPGGIVPLYEGPVERYVAPSSVSATVSAVPTAD